MSSVDLCIINNSDQIRSDQVSCFGHYKGQLSTLTAITIIDNDYIEAT